MILIAYTAREKMPRYMVPKFVGVLSELPKTTSGKVDYPALRRRRDYKRMVSGTDPPGALNRYFSENGMANS